MLSLFSIRPRFLCKNRSKTGLARIGIDREWKVCLGWPRTGCEVKHALSWSKACWHSKDQTKGRPFFFKSFKGSAILENPGTKRWYHPDNPRNLCTSLRFWGLGKTERSVLFQDLRWYLWYSQCVPKNLISSKQNLLFFMLIVRPAWCSLLNTFWMV